ncbi:P-loop containing nucleoside triphosphate hydrolase protein, partial [Dipodascopsis tothii]|uniref:P-loop containing nucleoside triphosphate hydrolase protein n=1 Tax=Dipodascopsis tothii TaxID=44089 RepID=UPI0034CFC0D6
MTQHQKLYIVAGPAGCGKSTVATQLATRLGAPFIEGDELHSKENVAKMDANVPLTDDDRDPWLRTFVPRALEEMDKAGTAVAVATCSALKAKYRDIIRDSAPEELDLQFVFLTLDMEALMARVRARKNHYMKDTMVASQLEICEIPATEPDAVVVNVTNKDAQTVEGLVREALGV